MITIGTNSLYIFSLDKIFELANQASFSGVELGLRDNTDAGWASYRDSKYLNKLSRKYKLKINSIHINFGFPEEILTFKKILKLKKDIGANYIICHIPYVSQTPYIKWFLKNKDNKNILWENIHVNKKNGLPYWGWNKVRELKNICCDIAHSARNNEVYDMNNKNIKQYHLSFWDGKEDHLNLIGKEKYLKNLNLRKANYCLEICPKAYNLKNVLKILKENNKVLKQLYG